MKRFFILFLILSMTIFVFNADYVFAEEEIIELGNVHYSEAPKTWQIQIPDEVIKVEVGVSAKGKSEVNKYGGWKGYMKLNGSLLWKMKGLNEDKQALIEDYIIKKTVLETTGKNAWLDITGVVKVGANELTYYHYTGGDGATIKLRITKKVSIKEDSNKENTTNVAMNSNNYNIQILSSELRYFETIIKGRLTNNGIPVSNVQIGVEDPLKKMSLLGPKTDINGYFTYTTNPYINYRSAEEFLFAYKDVQTPYIIAERFSKYEVVKENVEENEVYKNLSEARKQNVILYQRISNGMESNNTLSIIQKNQAKSDVMDIMLESALSQKVSKGMEFVDWAGSVGMCAKGVMASGATFGASTVACTPLSVKLFTEGVDASTDVLVKKGYIKGRTAEIIDNASQTATSCISITDPIDTASCLGALASGTLHVVSYELESNDYGQPAVVIKISKTLSNTVDYALIIIDAVN